MIKGERVSHLDYAKAIAIFFVITLHVGFYQINSFFLFAMPLFFVVTGYSFSLGKRSIKESVYLRFKAIMLPFWIFMLVYIPLEVVRAYIFGYSDYSVMFPALAKTIYGSGVIPFENNITAYLKEVMAYKGQPAIGVDVILPASCHLWFLPAMFTGYVMFIILVESANKNHWLKVIYVVSLLFIASIETVFPAVCQLPLGLGRGAIGAAFMLVGFWLKESKIFEKKSIVLNIIFGMLATSIYIVALCLGSNGGLFVRSIYGGYGAISLCITFVGGTCGAVILLQLCRLIEKIPVGAIKNFLSFVGKNVIVFYILHMLVKFVLDAIYIVLLQRGETVLLDEYKMGLMPETSLVFMMLEVVAIIVICALIAKLYQRVKTRVKN